MADSDMVPHYLLFTLPTQVPPRIVVSQSELQDDDDSDDDTELPLLMLKKMPDHVFTQVISNLPLRLAGTFIANYACRRLNRILATTARLVPLAYDPSQSRPWNIMVQCRRTREINGVPRAYDPISNRWYNFRLKNSGNQQKWIWDKIASADGLVCVPGCSNLWEYATYKLEMFDPYTQRFRTLPPYPADWAMDPGEQYTVRGPCENFSANIWIIDPATCEYKVIVMRCMFNSQGATHHVFVDSYDRTRGWQNVLRNDQEMSLGWRTQGSTAICHDTLYIILRNESLDEQVRETIGNQLFLYRFHLRSMDKTFTPANLYPMPGSFRISPAAVILNCNDNLILVGSKGTAYRRARSVKVWRFNPHQAGWLKLGVMPQKMLHMLNKPVNSPYNHQYTGGGDFIYFRNCRGNRVVVLDLSMTDGSGVQLREEAWKEAPTCPIGGKGQLCYSFCYEPRLLIGVPL